MLNNTVNFVFILLVIFQLKHLVADYFLQGKYMLQKFKPGWDFFFPLLAHVTVHGGMTLAVCLYFAPHLWWLALVDMGIHFTMDRLKAGPKYMGRWKPLTAEQYKEIRAEIVEGHISKVSERVKEAKKKIRGNTLFWLSLGVDQGVHHLTHYAIIYMILTA